MKAVVIAAVFAACMLGAVAENEFTYHVQDGDFSIDTVELSTAGDVPYASGVLATVTFSGTVSNASSILAGTIQYKIYENYVQHFTDSGNSPYFQCTNKGCDRNQGIALSLADPDATTPSKLTGTFSFAMPVAQKTGQFRMVFWGSNQDHFPYDFSALLGFNYTSADADAVAAAAAVTPNTTNSYQPGQITWAAAPGNMTVATAEILAMNGQFVASESAHVQLTGELNKTLTAGAVQWQVYEQGVRSFIESGNSNYFKCTNKGCNILDPIALTLESSSVPTNYTLKFAFNIPTPEATGQFTLVAWGTDQDHFPYDFSLSAHFVVPMN